MSHSSTHCHSPSHSLSVYLQLVGINLQQASTPGTVSYAEHMVACAMVGIGGVVLAIAACIPKARGRYWSVEHFIHHCNNLFHSSMPHSFRPVIGTFSALMATAGVLLYWILALYDAEFHIPGAVGFVWPARY